MKKIIISIVAVIFAATLFLSDADASMGICGGGSFKSYMTIGALSKRSGQYKYLVNNTKDRGDGLLVTSDGYIAVAMGPYYGKMGDKFIVTFSNGQKTKVVKVDQKAHFKPGCEGMASRDGSVLEGILSGRDSSAYRKAKLHGNIGKAYKEFAGTSSITSIIKVGGSAANPVTKTKTETKTKTKKPTKRPSVPQQKEEVKTKLMIIYIPNEEHENLLFVDTEFSGPTREVVQAALINFKKLKDRENRENLYFLSGSLNLYKNIKVTTGFENYTNIKQGFLGNHGVDPEDFVDTVNNFIESYNLNTCNTLIISHGQHQDVELLLEEGCNLLFVDRYDTFQQAKIVLEISSGLSLEALASSAGYFPSSNHDAYQDAFALIPIFSHLKTVENLKLNRK